ncbi:MAG: hypothetical protein K0R15_2488 [Clostridiales bacterium]|jgi:hypothetical protein|nr:hypothetical protein [Clostridiales bacterium]
MEKRKLTNFQIELIIAMGFVLLCAVIVIFLKEPKYVSDENKITTGIVSNLPPKKVVEVTITPEEEALNKLDLAAAADYIQDDNLSKLLQTVIGFTKEDFDGSPPIHTQLMILLLKANNHEIRESDGLDATNNLYFFLDKTIAKTFLEELFITLDFDTTTIPDSLSTFIYYEGDDIYLRRLTFNTERTKITKATPIVIDNEEYVELHTITYMYDTTAKDNMRSLYECDVTVKKDEESPYGYKLKSITNFKNLT